MKWRLDKCEFAYHKRPPWSVIMGIPVLLILSLISLNYLWQTHQENRQLTADYQATRSLAMMLDLSPAQRLQLAKEAYGQKKGLFQRQAVFNAYYSATPFHQRLYNQAPVWDIQFSADGKQLLTRSDNRVRIWDLENGQLSYELRGHQDLITSARFSPNDRYLLTASLDGTARLWNQKTGQLQYVLDSHGISIIQAWFDLSGRWVVTALSDGTSLVWDSKTGIEAYQLGQLPDQEKEPEIRTMSEAVFSSTGLMVTLPPGGTSQADIWNLENGKKIGVLNYPPGIQSLAYCPSTGQWVTGGQDGNTVLWDALTHQQLKVLKGGQTAITTIECTQNGWLLTGSRNGVLKWYTPSQTIRQTIKMDPVGGFFATVSPDQKYVLGGDQNLEVWDMENGYLIQKLNIPGFHMARFSPTGEYYATASNDGMVQIWPIHQYASLVGHHENLVTLSFSPDSQQLATASYDGTVYIWAGEQKRHRLINPDTGIQALSFSPDSRWLAGALSNGSVIVWDIQNGQKIKEIKAHKGGVNEVQFSPNGQDLVSVSSSAHTVNIWHWQDGRLLQQLSHEYVDRADFSSTGQFLLTQDRVNRVVHLWTPSSGVLVPFLPQSIKQAVFSQDGRQLAAVSQSTIDIWQIEIGQLLHALRGLDEPVVALGFISEWKIWAANEQEIRIWDLKNGEPQYFNLPVSNGVTAVSLAENGQFFLVSTIPDTHYLLDRDSGKILASIKAPQAYLSPDGQMIASLNEHLVQLWPATPEAILKMLKNKPPWGFR